MSEPQAEYKIEGLEEVFDQLPANLDEGIRTLADLRLVQTLARERLSEMQRTLESSEEWLRWYSELRAAETDAGLLEDALRKAAMDAYAATGDKHPHVALGIRVNTRLVYDPEAAVVWCRTNLPQALKLDAAFFEKHARAVKDTAPVDFVTVVFEPSATIPTDLSKYLEG